MLRRGLCVLLALAVMGCFAAKTVQMTKTTYLPAAEGKVKVDETDNGNLNVKLEVKHLATPNEVQPGAQVYVLWLAPTAEGQTLQNMGALRVNKDLDGEIEVVTPHRAFDLFITAESSQTVSSPSGNRLMMAEVRR